MNISPAAPASSRPAKPKHTPLDELFTAHQLTMVTGGWVIAEFILIRETRTCTCGVTHTATASHPRVLLTNKHGDTKSCSMQDVRGLLTMLTSKLREEFKWPTLPRSIMDVNIPVSCCEACFTTLEPAGEDLFTNSTSYPLNLSTIRRLITFAEDMQPTAEELRAARDGRISASKPCSPAIVPLDLSML